MLSIPQFTEWLDNCCRDAESKGISKADMAIVLLDKARELILKALLERQDG